MNALEALAAAIEKLEALRAATSPGPWIAEDGYVRSSAPWTTPHGHEGPRSVFMAEGNWVDGYAFEEHDAELIVILHWTIDAQLAILDEGARTVQQSHGNPITPAARRVVDLARSILGGSS